MLKFLPYEASEPPIFDAADWAINNVANRKLGIGKHNSQIH